jgi:hypothetical protein
MRPDLGFPMEKVTCAKFECSWLKRVLVTDLINLGFELANDSTPVCTKMGLHI